MKQFFRTLCLGLAATCVAATSFAQGQDVTAKYLRNADMEQGRKYWSLSGGQVLSTQTKRPATQVGFHGMNQGVLEAWHANSNTPLDNSTTMQRMKDLPNGTYVFGAYVGASKQGTRRVISMSPYVFEYWSNRDSIYGVSLYANADAIPVATDNPDYGGSGQKWAHSSKFNVATTVTNGILEVGIKVDSTNANYVVWDNATLYYFGNMSKAEALDAMAEIDMVKAVAIADTLRSVKMNVDTLNLLSAVIAEANATNTTAATLWNDNENLFWVMGLARKSETDYKNLAKNIDDARVVTEGEWSEYAEANLEALKAVLAEAEAAYEAVAMNRAELTALRKELIWATGDVKYDSVTIAKDALEAFIQEAKSIEGVPGGYSGAQIAMLRELQVELLDTMVVYEEDAELDFEERTVNPNRLYPYIARVYETIENVRNNPIALEYTQMPIEFKPSSDVTYIVQGTNCKPVDGSVVTSEKLVEFASPLYCFQGLIEKFRITVKNAAAGQHFFCLSELVFYDKTGAEIELTAENITSNADHITLNPGSEGPEGTGIPALVDGDVNTFFHSDWSGKVNNEYHYLEVTLPNGGYDAFSFKMVSRGQVNNAGVQTGGQRHTFPGEMIIDTPRPECAALEALVAQAQAYNAYSYPEVGYYVKDFSYLTDAIAKAEALLAGYPTEDECRAMNIELRQAVLDFEVDEDKAIRLPEAGKAYRIVSALPGFFEKQRVEKAMTVHVTDTTTTLWWENVAAGSQQQEFVFEPVLSDGGEQYIEIVEEGIYESNEPISVPYYCYYMKHVATGCYVDYEDDVTFRLVEEPTDTVMLKSLGRGQWNIMTSGSYYNDSDECYMHAGDHNNGYSSSSQGRFGGIYGISSGIIAWLGDIAGAGASSWYICEMPALPLSVLVEAGEFKSELFHFEAANTITLTADKACAFEGLTLYDRYDVAIAIDSLAISGNTATIVQDKNFVACAFAFTNNEGVNSVTFDVTWSDPIPAIAYLQEAYDDAVALAPIEGTEVGQFADLSQYTAAIEAAESILATGVTTYEEAQVMIEQLESAVAGLVPNMPEAGRMYYIVSGLERFEINNGVSMMMYVDEDAELLKWTYEDLYSLNRCWEFEQATEEELEAEGMPTDVCAYYIKNVATGLYVGDAELMSSQVPMAIDKATAIPYAVTLLSGKDIALDGLARSSKRIHANGHGSGAGKGSNIVYWASGAGTASAWRICGTEAYGLNYFATYTMEAQAVEATQASVVTIPIEMTNTTAVSAFRFDLYLPEGVSVDDITFNGERAENTHVLATSLQANGALRVEAYSTTDAAFEGNAGVVVNVTVSVGESVADGNYPVTLRNVRMVKAGAKEVLGADHTSTLTIYGDAMMGDVNNDGNFTMIDVVMTVNAVLEKEQTGFNANAADLNGDGQITMVDVVGVLQLVLTDSSSKAPVHRDSNRTVSMPVLNACELEFMGNGGVVLPVALCNGENYSAFQLDVQLPAGVELTDVELAGRAKASHTMAWNTLSDGTIRVVAY
ncbi:MAG: dockerin type I repeat-containing protein, partial [Bacteroidaceae bacterium]|nr:dockerin type I repeat-containing protein [Bacteroidaceae bacterium]